MRKKTGQSLSSIERQELILSVLRQPKKMRELCGQYGVGVASYYKWRNRFFQAGLSALDDHKRGVKGKIKPGSREKELSDRMEQSQRRINELAVEVEVLKKKESWPDEE